MKSKINFSGKDAFGWLLIGISVLMLGKSVALCFSNDIWYDELFTVGMIEHSYGELIQFTAADVHPPLYYCVTKFFADLCKLIIPGAGTVVPAKIVSVLPYFILLLYSVTFVRKRYSIFTGGLFLFCVISMPQMSAYTVEVRMYGWALLFVTAAFFHAYGCVEAGSPLMEDRGTTGSLFMEDAGRADNLSAEDVSRTDRKNRRGRGRCFHGTALVLYGLAAAYTQYFACVAVVMVYLYVLAAFWFQDKRRVKEWLWYVAVSIVGYIPWLFALMGQISAVRENYWILPLTWRSIGGCVKFLMKPAFRSEVINVILAVVVCAGYVLVVGGFLISYVKINRIKSGNSTKVYHNGRVLYPFAGLFVLIGLVVFGFAASILIRPVFVYRYMIPAAGCFWLCLVICLDEMLCKLDSNPVLRKEDSSILQSNRVIVMLRGLLSAFLILLIVIGLRNYRAFLGEEEYKILLMKDTESALAQIESEDIVLYNFDQVQAVTSYYLKEESKRYLWNGRAESLIQEIIGPCETVEETDVIKDWLVQEQTEQETGRRIWFIGSFNSREEIAAQWRKEGLVVEEKGSYLLERYWFNLYEIRLADS